MGDRMEVNRFGDDVTANPESRAEDGPQRLAAIAADLKKKKSVDPVPVRELLGWFGSARRGARVVAWVRECLAKVDLSTDPDFEAVYVDQPIRFVLTNTLPETKGAQQLLDPTLRISRLRSAITAPTSVKPNQSILEATTIMFSRDFSQLPVMTSEREVKGIVSWRSIGRRFALGVHFKEVRECMDSPKIIPADTSLFDAIRDIVTFECVLVTDEEKKICGIVTTSDLSLQFRQLTEPFLLLREIENHVRRLIQRGKFSPDELKAARDPTDTNRDVKGIFDLSFGEYVRILEDPKLWVRLNLQVDRTTFVKDLDRVRRIRNDVMHFDPDGDIDQDLQALRDFTTFLQTLTTILPAHK